MDGVFEEQVRQRAYEIWVGLGRMDGQAHDHWIAAERDLLALPAAAKTPRKPAAKAAKTTAAKPAAKAPKAAKPRAKHQDAGLSA